ncbi:hypothetical protein L5515_000261 [Caenorhabditis briggsae]|uniref:Uncharacterized protein n=1 Tax=Caenorhabditis briggsae TaxID=6238 RepID=A0AAE9DZ72_CAEBR|nr:hypothetical protein L3Y34_014170 [Caenorhabditis briggsae]UMM10533.1 hypothetical protein L5515_000261 [Caenorhabditis briggsae]
MERPLPSIALLAPATLSSRCLANPPRFAYYFPKCLFGEDQHTAAFFSIAAAAPIIPATTGREKALRVEHTIS